MGVTPRLFRSERTDLDFSKLDLSTTPLQCDGPLELRILYIDGCRSVEYDDEARAFRRDVEGIPLPAGFQHRTRQLRHLDDCTGTVRRIWTLVSNMLAS